MPDVRFAPANPIRIADRAAGLNAVSVRSYNERLVLSMLLQHGSTTRFDIGEKTGLSAQTVSVIVRSLEQEGLVTRGEAQRGRMGPPTIPMALNPEGVFSIGISIGFRTTDIVLIDFVGGVIDSATLRHEKPGADHVHPALFTTVEALLAKVSKAKRRRFAGIGLALPDAFGDTRELTTFKTLAEEQQSLDVFVQNDVTAAANGESLFGVARDLDNYLFFYIGAMVHSRLELNHQVHRSGVSSSYEIGLLHFERALGATGDGLTALVGSIQEFPKAVGAASLPYASRFTVGG